MRCRNVATLPAPGIVVAALCTLGAVGFPAIAQGQGPPPGPMAAPVRPVRVDWDEHPTLLIGRSTRIEGRIRIQADARDADVTGSDEPAGGVDVARRRVGVQGVLFDVVEFEVDRELRHDRPWRDVYVNIARWRAAQVQAGQFKLPFGLDENASSTNLNFVFRALASNHLAPGRDRGVMVHGRVLRRLVRYEAAVFDYDGRNARTDNPGRVHGGRTTAIRVRVTPLANARKTLRALTENLHVGVALTRSEVPEGIPAVRGRMVLDAPFSAARYNVNGARQRMGAELRWRPGPFSVESEYMRMTTERRGEGVDDGNLSPLLDTGWYVSGTVALTGERKARGLDRPRRPFLRGGIGALELAVRAESMALRSLATGTEASLSPRADQIRGNRDRAATVGVNWYLNRWIKVQGNIIHERLDDPALGPVPGQGTFWSRVLRLQVTL